MVTLIQKSLLIYNESINNYKHEHKINSVSGRGEESDKLTLNLEKNELIVPVAILSIVTKFTKTVILDDKISNKNNFIVIIDHVTHFCAALIKN